jgi:hypothetical protein
VSGGGWSVFFDVEGQPPGCLSSLHATDPEVRAVEVIDTGRDGGRVEVVLHESALAASSEAGAILTGGRVGSGRARSGHRVAVLERLRKTRRPATAAVSGVDDDCGPQHRQSRDLRGADRTGRGSTDDDHRLVTVRRSGGDAPRGRTWDRSTFRPVATAFVERYADVYAEPGVDEDAWDPDRLEYEARVSAGAGGDETVFETTEYRGGRMDWYAFSATTDSLRESGAATDGPTSLSRLPTRTTFQGMPASRLWEMEDANVDLASVSAAEDDLARLFLLEFALVAGDDWFTLPLEAPVGSVTRVTDLSVRDTFGVEVSDVPARVDRSDEWGLFTFDLPARDEPGLFLPPVVGTSQSGETVEDVLFARDENATLVFGIESVVEGALGDPLDRDQFHRPTVEVETLHTAGQGVSGDDAADAEYIDLHNPGDAPLDLDGWTLYTQYSEFATPASASNADTLDLSPVTLPPAGSVRVVTGGDAALDTAERVPLERTAPVLAADRVVSVKKPLGDGSEGLVTVRPVSRDRLEEYPTYRLANEVPDHWFPHVRPPADESPASSPPVFRYELGLLLDDDALSGTVDAVPTPQGRILDPDACIYDEEIPRGGLRVTRTYQSTAWLDGTTYVWSSREVRPGVGEVSSGLRVDYLENEEAE